MKPLLLDSLRAHRLAIGLALAALLAQLALGTLSVAHQAQMVGGGAWDVCTARGVERVGDEIPGSDTWVQAATGCAVCAAAAATLVAGGASAAAQQVPWRAPQLDHAAPTPQSRIARLRPPARAPPATA